MSKQSDVISISLPDKNGSLNYDNYYNKVLSAVLMKYVLHNKLNDLKNLIIQKNITLDIRHYQLLINAVIKDNLATAKYLINEGINPKFNNSISLLIACQAGSISCLKHLTKIKGIKLSPKLLQAASQHNHPEIVKFLLDNKLVNPYDKKNAAFNLACKFGNLEVIQEFLKNKNFSLNKVNFGRSLLIAAKFGVSIEETEKLIEDAKLKIKGKRQYLKIVKELAKKINDVNSINKALKFAHLEFTTASTEEYKREVSKNTYKVILDSYNKHYNAELVHNKKEISTLESKLEEINNLINLIKATSSELLNKKNKQFDIKYLDNYLKKQTIEKEKTLTAIKNKKDIIVAVKKDILKKEKEINQKYYIDAIKNKFDRINSNYAKSDIKSPKSSKKYTIEEEPKEQINKLKSKRDTTPDLDIKIKNFESKDFVDAYNIYMHLLWKKQNMTPKQEKENIKKEIKRLAKKFEKNDKLKTQDSTKLLENDSKLQKRAPEKKQDVNSKLKL